jgi:hypothetical protein
MVHMETMFFLTAIIFFVLGFAVGAYITFHATFRKMKDIQEQTMDEYRLAANEAVLKSVRSY